MTQEEGEGGGDEEGDEEEVVLVEGPEGIYNVELIRTSFQAMLPHPTTLLHQKDRIVHFPTVVQSGMHQFLKKPSTFPVVSQLQTEAPVDVGGGGDPVVMCTEP